MVAIFDLGNVVLNWNVDGILRTLDVNQPERDLLSVQLFNHQDWLDMDQGLKSESTVTERIVAESGLRKDLIKKAFLTAKQSLVPIPHSIQLMKDVHAAGVKMYCLSNMSSETYEHIKSKEFFDLFEGIVISGREKCMKPNARIFQLTMERYNLVPTETLFIDDSLPNIHTAGDLGMQGFHFQRSDACYSRIRELLL